MYKKKIGARAFTAVTVASLLASNVTPAMAAEDANAMAKAAKKAVATASNAEAAETEDAVEADVAEDALENDIAVEAEGRREGRNRRSVLLHRRWKDGMAGLSACNGSRGKCCNTDCR